MQKRLQYEVRRIRKGPHAGKWIWEVGYIDQIVPGFNCFSIEASSRGSRRWDDPEEIGLYAHAIAARSAARAAIRKLGGA